ncbi:hypothetical protein GH714_013176 [Hevea brasiliensis]|uniref:PI-PLC Y-box domain-containing protein n=1 Tax=Hevea brasiliensis TaxID=3981 RepID=A0A6A6N2K9_HEVBR|nr:hypothetical protein GH714_013176 [Hevea brasiliensis]
MMRNSCGDVKRDMEVTLVYAWKFRANGGCGYVKKPDFLLKSGPHGESIMGEGWRNDFDRTHFDAFSPPDFYARVGIAGVPADTIMKKTKTLRTIGFLCGMRNLSSQTVPELALLRIEVHEYDMSEKDDFGGQTCLPVSELRRGIRAVPLHNHKGEKYKSVKTPHAL